MCSACNSVSGSGERTRSLSVLSMLYAQLSYKLRDAERRLTASRPAGGRTTLGQLFCSRCCRRPALFRPAGDGARGPEGPDGRYCHACAVADGGTFEAVRPVPPDGAERAPRSPTPRPMTSDRCRSWQKGIGLESIQCHPSIQRDF